MRGEERERWSDREGEEEDGGGVEGVEARLLLCANSEEK